MTIHSTYIKDKKLYSISMGKNFNLRDQKEFIAVYKNLPTDAIRVELDMKKTNHIDHSALSMMLVMNKCIHEQIPCVDIVNINQGMKKILDISRFKAFFNISEN